jgi:hypothetical protein
VNCTKCGNKTEIIDTEKYSMFVWRRRRCMTCDHRMSTHENFVEDSKTCRTAPPKQSKPKVKAPKQPKPKPPNVTELPVVNKRRLIESLKEELERKRRDECDEDFDGGL